MEHTAQLSPEIQQWFNLGVRQLQAGNWAEAEFALARVLTQHNGDPDVQHQYGIALKAQGKFTQAISALHTALALRPEFPEAFNSLGEAYREMNQPDQSKEAFRRALELRPNFPEVYLNLALLMQKVGRPQAAIEGYRRALAQRPDFAQAWNNLGNELWRADQLTQAIDAFRRVVTLQPQQASGWNNLALVLKDTGQLDEAVACFDRAIAIAPNDVAAASNRLHSLHYHAGYDNEALFREAQRWNQQFALPFTGEITAHTNERDPGRRIRVGYVSPDFREHCVAMFIMPLLSHHDHAAVEVFCYSNAPLSDGVTARFKSHADHWRDIGGLTDPQAASLIRQDKIDILVDLALHTAGNRLQVFARKPAPIQATWLGYPGTTGLDAIDYRLTDPRFDPPASDPPQSDPGDGRIGAKAPFYSERSLRVPETFWCYDPRAAEQNPQAIYPAPSPLPALATGRVTFGCLNNFCKVTDRTLQLWAGVLAAAPAAQLLMVAPTGPCRDHVLSKLGVGPDRVQFVTYQPRRKYLELFSRVDLCLDTLPCNGGTTSLEALWMGVPVLTRVGRTVVGRAGWSLLHHLGLTELVAQTDEQFVSLAAQLAGDLDRLGGLRANLRERMERSPLMDGTRFARDMEATYRQMWQAWCSAPHRSA